MAPAEPKAIPFRAKGEEPYFAEERKGWKGYVEWEKYPEKKRKAAEILNQYDFPEVCCQRIVWSEGHMTKPILPTNVHLASRVSAAASARQKSDPHW
jgi:hypothetical protein